MDSVKEGDCTFDAVKTTALQKMIEINDNFKRKLENHVTEHGC